MYHNDYDDYDYDDNSSDDDMRIIYDNSYLDIEYEDSLIINELELLKIEMESYEYRFNFFKYMKLDYILDILSSSVFKHHYIVLEYNDIYSLRKFIELVSKLSYFKNMYYSDSQLQSIYNKLYNNRFTA